MEFVNPQGRRDKAKDLEMIKELLHEKGIITKEEIRSKKSKKSKK